MGGEEGRQVNTELDSGLTGQVGVGGVLVLQMSLTRGALELWQLREVNGAQDGPVGGTQRYYWKDKVSS